MVGVRCLVTASKALCAHCAAYKCVQRHIRSLHNHTKHTHSTGKHVTLLSRPVTPHTVRHMSTRNGNGQSPMQQYNDLLKSGKLRPDERQVGAMQKLNNLYNCLQSNPEALRPRTITPDHSSVVDTTKPSNSKGLFGTVSGWFSKEPEKPKITANVPPVTQAEVANADRVPCKSLYLYGGVGCGKTMLMDLFYHSVQSEHKLRQHFHAFMLDIHKRLHQLRLTQGGTIDPVVVVAANLASMYRLICLDEFQVTDVADAMILRRLFSNLFNNGVIVVATSNRVPTDLYKNGINRTEFLPFIDVLQAYCVVHEMQQGSDHRLMGTLSHGIYHYPNNDKTTQHINHIFEQLAQNEHDTPKSIDLTVGFGRSIKVPKCTEYVALYSFDELCSTNYGANDYIALAEKFPYVIIHSIPVLGSDRNKVRRFITLLDIFYEQHVRVIFGAEKPVEELFDKDVDTAGDEQFASGRAISRMNEMQSKEYFNLCAYNRDGSTGTNTEFDKIIDSNSD